MRGAGRGLFGLALAGFMLAVSAGSYGQEAAAGNAQYSLSNIAKAYRTGVGLEQNPERAAHWQARAKALEADRTP